MNAHHQQHGRGEQDGRVRVRGDGHLQDLCLFAGESDAPRAQKRGIKKLKVVYSKEPPITPLDDISISCRTHCICPPGTAHKCTQRWQVPGSNAFVPAAVGLLVAGEVVKDLTAWERPL